MRLVGAQADLEIHGMPGRVDTLGSRRLRPQRPVGHPRKALTMSILKFIAAIVFATASTLGAGVVGALPITAAQARQWDQAAFDDCAEGYEAQREDDYVTWYYGVRQCCTSFGGVWHEQQPGQAPRCDPPPRIVRVPPGLVVQTLSPALSPVTRAPSNQPGDKS
jgi:hypothetical protein